MARLRCEVLEREGPLPRVVRDEAGRVLRLYADAPPAGAHWLGHIDGIGVWATPMGDPVTTEPLEVVWLDTPALDEVSVGVGPDRGDALGLFDSPTSASTGEHTEGASSPGPDRVGEQRRTSVLAWIAAQEAHAPVPIDRDAPVDRAEPVQGAPCERLKRLVADEPLDPLPALDGVPWPRPGVGASPAEPRRAFAPEREDTATQIDGFDGMMTRTGGDATSPEGTPPPGAPDAPPPVAATPPGPRLVLLVALAAAVAAWVLQAAW